MRLRAIHRTVVVLAATLMVASACLNVFWRTEVNPIDPKAGVERVVRGALKVHMVDGSTVVFRDGATIGRTRIAGAGVRYALMTDEPRVRNSVPMDSVVALEAFEGKVLAAPTILVTAAATAVGYVAGLILWVAIFGSCPTIYADAGSGLELQAEGFSYAIAPLFEHRDVDRLRVRPDSDGVIRLELRNEALETHYINSIELAAVRHPAGTLVVPDQSHRLVALRDVRQLSAATDRSGRDVRAQLSAVDSNVYITPPSVRDAAQEGDLHDWIDLEANDLPPGDSVAVVLRLRNSLLNTILLYDEMLSGPDAVNWIGTELQRISTAVDLSRWYERTMGLHAIVAGDSVALRTKPPSARLNDVGPIAFHDVAMIVPRVTTPDGRVRVRLRFVADNWRIARAAIAGTFARPSVTVLPVTRVVIPTPARGGPPLVDTAAVGVLARSDDRYLQTQPGQRLTLEFVAPVADTAEEVTYLITWQGWYREWIRRDWLTRPARTTAYVPGDSALASAMRTWRIRQPEFERAFYASRIPVR